MHSNILYTLMFLLIIAHPAISQDKKSSEPHRYGGWYCPDNLNGFPAVDIADWENVPHINGRMPTEEETRNGTSLILVDMEKYPNAKPLDMTMPRLATIRNHATHREEIIIVIQAINVDNDSVVGFRYLNGGNGSAWLDEVEFLDETEVDLAPESKFVTHTITIEATQEEIWPILSDAKYAEKLHPIFDPQNKLPAAWRDTTNVNFHYIRSGDLTSFYGGKLYGCYYIQNDYDRDHFTEKFLLLEDNDAGTTELKITCGPFTDAYAYYDKMLAAWGNEVKRLSETQ